MPSTPTLALGVGALGSGAAQVAWNWPLGVVHVVAGLFATALVPISLHLWLRVPITGRWTRAIRAAVMTYICLAAAGVNLVHATWLLTDYQPVTELHVKGTVTRIDNAALANTILAILLITAVEAVMVMASLARRAPAAAQPRRKTPTQPVTPKATPKPTTVADAVAAVAADEQPEPDQPTATGLTVAEWYALNPTATAKEIQLATGCARSYSYRLVKENAS